MSEERVKQLQPYWETWIAPFLKEVYSRQEYVRGEELLRLTPIEALNKLLIKQLFDEWRQAIEQSKSAYFDYEHPRVKAALQEYANVLSYHIKIDAEAMRRLLHRTLPLYVMLLFSPYHFFVHFFEHNPVPILGVEELKKQLKYIKHYDFLLQALIERMEQQRMQALPPIALLGLFKVVYEQLGNRLVLDSEAIAAFLDMIGYTDEQALQEKPGMEQPTTEKLYSPETKQTMKADREVVKERQEETPHIQLNEDEQHDVGAEEEDDYYGGLNERFKQRVSHNINLKLPQTQHRSFRDIISLHERFMFVEQLFAGSYHAYQQLIQEIEKVDDLQSAMKVLRRYAQEKNWKPSEALDALEAAVKRAFG